MLVLVLMIMLMECRSPGSCGWFGLGSAHTRRRRGRSLLPPPHAHIRNPPPFHHLPQELGKYGIICVEDLIHEIYSCGPHFKQVRPVARLSLSLPLSLPPSLLSACLSLS